MLSKADSVRLYKIRKAITELSSKEGRGTELVSLYIPPKKPLHEVIAYLRNEWGTAGNIKSDTTRNHVQDALTKTMQRLKLYRETPETGLVIFSGALPTNGPGSEVIRLNEIVPPKSVNTFLYTCVAPDTKVLMEDGTQKEIGALESSWASERVMSWDAEERKLQSSGLREYLSIPVGGRKTYRLTVESGRSIVATEDHPFKTAKGWVRLGHLKEGDLLCVMPVGDMEAPAKGAGKRARKTLVNEDSIGDALHRPKNVRLAIKRLKERGLLPLRSDDPRLPVMARIMGHLLSDGSFYATSEKRPSGTYRSFTFDFCVGVKSDEEELRRDFAALGRKLPRGFETVHEMNVDGRAYITRTRHIKLRDSGLAALFLALGVSAGDKVKNGTIVPDWLKEGSMDVQREFLASYLGGDGTVPRMVGRALVSQSSVGFHRIEEIEDSGVQFAGDLVRLFSNLGVAVSRVDCMPGYLRKDGHHTVEIRVRIRMSEENILRLCHGVGVRYSSTKALSTGMVGEYLRIKARVRSENEAKSATARELSGGGCGVQQVGEMLATPQTTVSNWIQAGMAGRSLVKSSQLPTFEEWSKVAGMGLQEPMVWETITSIEDEAIPDVRDLSVDSENHSFFANGFLVHNCDDHFHVEFLKDMLKAEKVYGILSIDSNEAGIGILSGDRLDVEDLMTSGISGKTRKGGQCVGSDTILQTEDGRLVPISAVALGSKIASYNFPDYSEGPYQVTDAFALVPKEYYEVATERPMMRVSATGEHRFFTLRGGEVVTVQASRLRRGDKILVSRRLPEPSDPVLDTRFPAKYVYSVSAEGRRLLKSLRTRRRLTQGGLASVVGLHQTEVSQLERGERDLGWEKLKVIIRFLCPDFGGFLARYVENRRTLPEYLDGGMLQLLGYIAGDGNVDVNRVTLYESRMGIAETYAALAKVALGLEYVPIKKVDKTRQKGSFARRPYLETRIYSKPFADGLRESYPALVSVGSREVPEQVQRLDNVHLSRFLRGLFDAEGFVSKEGRRIGIAMKSGLLIRQLQMLLLRFGVVSSYSTYRNRHGSEMHRLDISDRDSLDTFSRQIGFSADDKQRRLSDGLVRRRAQSYMGVPVLGSWVDRRAKELGVQRRRFNGVTNYFHDQRGMSRSVFRKVVGVFEQELALTRGSNPHASRLQLLEETVSKLSMAERSELLLVSVKRIQLVKNTGRKRFVDIELPATRSFVGNGYVLHNSARRYERGREMELTYFFNRVAEHVTRIFITDHNVGGVIVGGPGPTKENFLKGGYLDYRLQKNVIEIVDTSYSGREGIREIAEKAADKLQDVRFIEERKLVQKFLAEINRPGGLAVYGLPKIVEALDRGNMDMMLISDDINITKVRMACKNCGTIKERIVENQKKMQTMQEMLSEPCTKCGAVNYDVDESDVVDMLEEKAMQVSAKIEVISSGTEEGAMLKSFGGTAGFLRYRI